MKLKASHILGFLDLVSLVSSAIKYRKEKKYTLEQIEEAFVKSGKLEHWPEVKANLS